MRAVGGDRHADGHDDHADEVQRDQNRIERSVEDDTLPTGKRTRTIVYEAPFDNCDREEDYRTVWTEFERRRAQA